MIWGKRRVTGCVPIDGGVVKYQHPEMETAFRSLLYPCYMMILWLGVRGGSFSRVGTKVKANI